MMRTLVVWCPDWPVTAAGFHASDPVAVVLANRVVACSVAARADGVERGQRRRQAQSRSPGLVVVEYDPARDARAFEPAVVAVEAFCPNVEIVRPGKCAFATRGPSRYFGGDHALAERVAAAVGRMCRVGVADGLFAAEQAARGRPARPDSPATVIPTGESAAFLAPLPARVLERPDLTDLLCRLGVLTLGDLAALPVAAVVGRFGVEGLRAHRLAAGLDERPPVARVAPPNLQVSTELDPPAERVDVAAFAAKVLADELHEALSKRGLACSRVRIEAETEHGEHLARLWRHDGTLTAAMLGERVRWQLDGWLARPGAVTAGITLLRLLPDEVHADDGRQLGFWGGDRAAADRAGRALMRLQGMLGPEAVLAAVVGGGREPADRVRFVPWGDAPPVLRAPRALEAHRCSKKRRGPDTSRPRHPPSSIACLRAPRWWTRPAPPSPSPAGGARARRRRVCRSTVGRGPTSPPGPGRGRLTSAGGRARPGAELAGRWSPPTVVPTCSRSRAVAGWSKRPTTELMGFNNPDMPWSELEARLSDGRRRNHPPNGDGGDSPAWSRKRQAYEPLSAEPRPRAGAVPYAELHCHSNFSFLDGASHPEELVEEAVRLGLEALALTDHDGVYGVVRFAEAARTYGLPTLFGAELSLGLTRPQNGVPDPEGHHLLVLARDPTGYALLVPGHQHRTDGGGGEGQAGHVARRAAHVARRPLAGAHRLPQGRGAGRARARTARRLRSASCDDLDRRVRARQRGRRAVGPRRPARLRPQRRARPRWPARAGVEVVATNNVHYAHTGRRPLGHGAGRGARSAQLDESTAGCLRRPPPTCAAGRSRPVASPAIPVRSSGRPSSDCAFAFDLHLVAPNLPRLPGPTGSHRDDVAA